MPLLDHFHPPLSPRRHWEALHSAWANELCRQLNDGLLPPSYFAEAHVHLGGRIEVDVAAFDEAWTDAACSSPGGVEVWAPPKPTRVIPLNFGNPDICEVRVVNAEEGPRLVAAIELISPSNKDRPSARHMFAVKCASYLQDGVGLVLADVVTNRSGNLHDELLRILDVPQDDAVTAALYAGAYRPVFGEGDSHLQCWYETLELGKSLPRLPLWIAPDVSLPVDLEHAYAASCQMLRLH